jgi:hypothetical protein
MKYYFAQIGIICFVIFAEPTISKWISTWILFVGLMVILTLFLISSRYHEYQFRGAQRGIEIAKFILLSFGIFLVLSAIIVFLYFNYNGDKFPQPIKNQLRITMKDNNPCFYIEPFNEMEAFDLYEVHVIKPPMPYEGYWCAGLCDKTKIAIPLSFFAGTEQCIPYGVKNKSFSAPSKKLQIDVLYEASIDASRRSIPKGKKEDDGNWLTANVWFYLSKNSKTGELNAIELSGSQVDEWIKNINDFHTSIETTKEKK